MAAVAPTPLAVVQRGLRLVLIGWALDFVLVTLAMTFWAWSGETRQEEGAAIHGVASSFGKAAFFLRLGAIVTAIVGLRFIEHAGLEALVPASRRVRLALWALALTCLLFVVVAYGKTGGSSLLFAVLINVHWIFLAISVAAVLSLLMLLQELARVVALRPPTSLVLLLLANPAWMVISTLAARYAGSWEAFHFWRWLGIGLSCVAMLPLFWAMHRLVHARPGQDLPLATAIVSDPDHPR